jgi:hypothetical protein
MLYRITSFTIIVFWVVMTTLLIRNEVSPSTSRLREIPVSYVLKQLFGHEQRSNLRIYNGSTPIGHVFMYPHVDTETDARVLEVTGSLGFDVGPEQKQRISWDSVIRMNAAFDVQVSEYRVRLHEPSDLVADIRVAANQPLVHVRLSSRGKTIEERDIAMNQSGVEGIAQQFGATGDVLGLLQQGAVAAKTQAEPVIRARLSSLRIGDQRTETFLVSMEYNGQTYFECHFSQLGQALQAKTMFGYRLQDELLP